MNKNEKRLKATDVFVPGGFPNLTYVLRKGENLEALLKRHLAEPGKFVSIAGPSKSGKTVLIESTVGVDALISISGARIQQADDVWTRVLDWMEAPYETSETHKDAGTSNVEGNIKIEGQIPLFAKAGASTKLSEGTEKSVETKVTVRRTSLEQVVHEIASSDFVILLDDFHYIPKDIQVDVMRHIKEAARLKVKICVASVLHRADAALRANIELQGRLSVIDINYWNEEELKTIASKGFGELKIDLDDDSLKDFAKEAAGTPQLMQTICLNACYHLEIEEALAEKRTITLSGEDRKKIYNSASRSMDFRTLVDVLDCGPKLRGKERKIYKFKDGTEGDVYRCILNCLANNPPCLSFSYDEILKRATRVCIDETPSGSSLQGSCKQMVSLADAKFAGEKAIDWNEEKELLDIPDPYLLFYLRWSDRLEQPNV